MTFLTTHIKTKSNTGFTLIELLIVIAVLGVLAAALLVTLDPLEQLARGRDAGRQSTIDQLGHSISAYYVANSNAYPAVGATWQDSLVTAGEMKLAATNPNYGNNGANCAAGTGENNYCFNASATDAVVYAGAESKSFKSKAGCTATQVAWIVWSSADGKTGLTCTASTGNVPAVGVTGLK